MSDSWNFTLLGEFSSVLLKSVQFVLSCIKYL